jgi:hypothetical protein
MDERNTKKISPEGSAKRELEKHGRLPALLTAQINGHFFSFEKPFVIHFRRRERRVGIENVETPIYRFGAWNRRDAVSGLFDLFRFSLG